MTPEGRLAGEPSVFRSISRHARLVAYVAVAFGILGIVVHFVRAPEYAAEAGVLLEDPRSSLILESPLRDADRYVADQISILKSPALLGRASELTTSTDASTQIPLSALQRNVSIRTTEGSSYVLIRVRSRDPDKAVDGANAVVRAYRELVRAELKEDAAAALRELDAAIAEVTQALLTSGVRNPSTNAALQELRSRRSRLEVDARLVGDGVSLFSPAATAHRQGASLMVTAFLAVVLGGLVGIGFAYAIDARELRRVRRMGPRTRLRAPALVEIPDFRLAGLDSTLPALDAPGTDSANAFRFLAATVGLRRGHLDEPVSVKLAEALQDEIPGMSGRELAMLDLVAARLDKIEQDSQKPTSRRSTSKRDLMLRSVAFVSPAPGGGTTTLVANTAAAAAQAGDRVLMLDGDLWGRGLTKLWLEGEESAAAERNGRRVGLTDMLLRGPLPEGIHHVTETEIGGTLSLIEPGATTLEAMNAIRTELIRPGLDATREDFDRVFIDVPPILQLPYANALVTSCDAVVVVAPHDGDPTMLDQLFDMLERLGVRAIGQVLNFVPPGPTGTRAVASDVRAGAEAVRSYVSRAPSRLRSRIPSRAAVRKPQGETAADDALGGPTAGEGRI